MNKYGPSIKDFEEAAKSKVNKFVWEYLKYPVGHGPSQTYDDSIEAFRRYRLKPRVLRDVSSISLSTSVLSQRMSSPICVSPTAAHQYHHFGAERATARAATDSGTLMVVSSCSSVLLEDISASNSSGFFWMQTYIFKKDETTLALVRAAESAGYKALVVTVDSANGQMTAEEGEETPHAWLQAEFPNCTRGVDPEERCGLPYFLQQIEGYTSTLQKLKWLRSVTNLKIVLKGVLTGKMTKLAAEEGIADGILVSAHGGRQLDGVSAPIDALAEVVEALEGTRVEVYVDGGVRTGTDILKALALGAKAVFIGRPVLWGLAVGGEEGVRQILNIYKEELKLAMALTGCTKVEDISPSVLQHESEYLSSKL